jgi:TRAP-type C4-dicarboxylate transport system permease small subunit
MSLQRIEEIFVSAGLTILILLVFISATLRWFGIDMSWSIDMAQLMFAWVCFIGADLAMRRVRHMGVDLLVDKLPKKVASVIYVVNNLLILSFLVLVVYYGVNLCIVNVNRQFNTLPLSYSFVTASAPVGALLMIMTSIRRIIDHFRNIKYGIAESYSETHVSKEGDVI